MKTTLDREGCIEIEPVPVAVQLQRHGRLVVAVPQEKIAPLTLDIVEKTRARLIEDRTARG